MKLLSLFVLLYGCSSTPLTESEEILREYDYQEYLEVWRQQLIQCKNGGGYLLYYDHIRQYPQGILNHPNPNRWDVRNTYCMSRDRF